MIIEPGSAVSRLSITRIQVKSLFGLYDYDLSSEPSFFEDASRLVILYGDNGSGKTTLLKLIFHLLSAAENRGHRSALARTPFRLFSLTLGGDLTISVEKTEESLTGSYVLTVRRGPEAELEVPVAVDPEGVVRQGTELYSKYIERLGIALQYLSDDRKPISGDTEDQDSEYMEYRRRLVLHSQPAIRDVGDVLTAAIKKLESWFRGQALRGSSRGELDSNAIYAEVARRIARADDPNRPADTDAMTLIERLESLEVRSEAFAAFGLLSRLDAAPIIESLRGSGAHSGLIARVVGPYLDGVEARMTALQEVQVLANRFVTHLSQYLSDKTVSFTLRDGLVIRSTTGRVLEPEHLSSGERQLLLLCCDTIVVRDEPTLVIIDEPELSLNIKWQQQLLETLLDLTRSAPVQFVIATHSAEVMGEHRESVRHLVATHKEV